MAYRFKRKESVAKAVRRVGRERIEHAIEWLRAVDQAKAIHGARKDIKKIRALLRLVHPQIAKKKFRRMTGRLQKTAANLAASRDAYIKSQTLRRLRLGDRFQGRLLPETLRQLQANLRKSCDEEMRRLEKGKAPGRIRNLLWSVAKMLKHLKVDGKEWKALGPGVKTAYQSARRAGRTVLQNPSDGNFHEWRKRVKDLWYQMRLLRSLRPEQMDATARELMMLGENLGDDHDLVVLKHDFDERFVRGGDAREWEMIYGMIETRQRELRASALAVGERLFAEKPSAFCDRLGGYWETWRRKKKPGGLSVIAPS